jgi:hypothetical protein
MGLQEGCENQCLLFTECKDVEIDIQSHKSILRFRSPS